MEKYLSECIESVVRQNLESYEIILIDDNSTDNSKLIINEYCDNYSQIRCISNKINLGVSTCRNLGIEAARGDYMYFLDSDDYMVPDVIPLMIENIIKDEADVLLVDAYRSFEDGRKRYYKNLFRGENISLFTGHAAWWALIRSSIVKCNKDIRFPENIHPGEDTIFMFILFSYAKSFSRFKLPVLMYRQHETSVMNLSKKNKNKRNSNLYACIIALDNFMTENKNNLQHRKKAYADLRANFISDMSFQFNFFSSNEKKTILLSKLGIIVKRFLYYSKLTNADRRIIKICKIPFWNLPV